MTDEQIIIEVAKLDGWVKTDMGTFHKEFPDRKRVCEVDKLEYYLTSRDAIVSAIEKQPLEVKRNIWSAMLADEEAIKGGVYILDLVLMSPKRLCIALLKATGKWKEEIEPDSLPNDYHDDRGDN